MGSAKHSSQPWTWERGNFPEVGKPFKEAPWEESGNPRIIPSAIFDTNFEIARKCDGVFKQNESQETLNSLFSCLRSSVKDT